MDAANQPPPPQGERIDPEKLSFLWGMAPLPISDASALSRYGRPASRMTIVLQILMQPALSALGLGFDYTMPNITAIGLPKRDELVEVQRA